MKNISGVTHLICLVLAAGLGILSLIGIVTMEVVVATSDAIHLTVIGQASVGVAFVAACVGSAAMCSWIYRWLLSLFGRAASSADLSS
ncbi:hypothetical protein [Paraburkholderia tuberum]|uniref:Uncharacterized protein n=1 Tax=Paraburkholderia tuberum TaxID=157910 RepID=A0A1H1KHD0_9BURK|nr:hypothetical protein [Paraburkholderia tuberum]SDR61175.1 hypothetical protein SAMN05445850_7597 [Paraburkholderia tuberum]